MSSTDITPSVLCALLVPEALEADLDASTLGQAGPIAGVPVPAEDSAGRTPGLTLSASGAQTATTTLAIATHHAGNVGQATYRVKRTVSGVDDASWRGADAPNVLTGFSGVGWSSSNRQSLPHAVTLADDTQVIVYAERTSAITPYDIKVQVWSPSTETYAAAVTVVTGLDASHMPWPWLLVMPDPQNRSNDPVLLLGYWVANDTTNRAQIDVHISRDGGTTWSYASRGALASSLTLNTGLSYYTLGRMRAAMVGSQVVLMANVVNVTAGPVSTEQILHYASSSAGTTFDLVDTLTSCGYPDVVSVGGIAWMLYADATQSGTSSAGYLTPIRNAYVPTNTGNRVLIDTLIALDDAATPPLFTFASMALVCLANRDLIVVYVRPAVNAKTGSAVRYRLTTSSTTDLYDSGISHWWWDGLSTSTEYPEQICASAYRDQVRIYGTIESSVATYENKLTRWDLGGLSTVTMPDNSAWRRTYIPNALPSVYAGWARTTTGGSDDISTTPGWHRIVTAASTRYYSYNPSSAVSATSQEIWQLVRVRQVSGGSISARDLVVGLRFAFAGTGYQVEVRCSGTQIRTFDVNGAATISTATVAVSSGIELLMALSGAGSWTLAYRLIGTDEDRNFTLLDSAAAVTDDAGAGGTVAVYYYGSLIASTVTAEYIPLGQQQGSTGTRSLAGNFSNPTSLRGIPYGDGTYALAGVKLTATGGPTLAGDTWSGPPDATYPIRHLLPSGDPESSANVQGGHRPSPREAASGWRSTATSGYLAFRHRGARNRFTPPLFVLHEEGLNVGTYPVYGYNEDAAAWDLIGTGDKRKSVRFTRTNATSPRIKVDTGNASTDEPYLYEGEAAGGWFEFPNGDIRPILWNGEGRWSSDGAHGLPYLELDPDSIDGGEDATGAGKIWYPRSTFYAYLLPTTKYSKYALYWSGAQSTYTGDLRANILAMGFAHPVLRTRDFGCIYELADPAELTTARSGLRFGSAVQAAPRLTITIPLVGPQDQAPLLDATTAGLFSNPYKLTSTSSMPRAGTVGDAFGRLMGAYHRSMGARDPVVYVPRLPYGPPDTGTLVGLTQAGHYGRMTSQPRFTDRYGRDTGAVHGAVYVGENVVIEGEL